MEKRPTVIGNCALFIVWPDPETFKTGNYDIEAIYKLKPRALLTVYEAACGISGSYSFVKFLYDDSLNLPPSEFGSKNWQTN